MESIWTMTADIQKRESLKEDITTDTAVIGGGMAGLLIASFLQKKGIQAVVLEAARIGSGQTKNTTAKISLQHGLIYHKLIEEAGEKKAKLYAEANRRAIAEYRNIINQKQISCEFRECSAYLYSLEETEPLKKEEEAAKSLGICAELTTKTELPFEVLSALKFYDQAVFHPLLFLKRIAEDLTIYEDTKVLTVERTEEENKVVTNHGVVRAKNVVFAAHYPFINVPGYYFLRMHQERSYVIALTNTKQMDNIYYGIDKEGLSFRKSGDYLLLGGGNHRTGENTGGGKYQKLYMAAEKWFPGCKEITRFSAQDCMPLDNIPYIGQFSTSTPDWYVATGFKKWGMTSSMVSAMIISDLILKGKSPYEEVFGPQRFDLQASAANLAEEGTQSVKGLSKGVFSTTPKCTHMGCALEWNPDEVSWDCPCHGSRFSSDGKVIDNPAIEDLSGE
ncbi:MAG: FAD-dependent oxidoreductase [Clostridiales bacterium]|nr:FAD-dependent oxidoreductase [Clostridiales bacterium]